MEVIINIISALLWLNIISSAAPYYVYDDVSRLFIPKANELSHAKYGFLHKKRFSGNGNPRYIRGPGDLAMHNAHFRIMKAPLMSFDEVQSWNAKEQQVHRNTESYKAAQERNRVIQEERKLELKGKPQSVQRDKNENKLIKMGNIGKDNRFDPKYNVFRVERNNIQDTETKETLNDNGIMKDRGSVKDDNGFMRRNENVKERQDEYRREGKGNVNKELLSDTQKSVKVTNAHPAAVAQFPAHYRWVSQMDKGEKKADRSSVVIQNVYEDINGKLTKRYESKKRETSVVTNEETPRPLSRENRVKYTRIAKEVMAEHFARVEPRKVGIPQLHFETEDVPYAVFYRANPITIDDQNEVLMDTGTVEDNSDAYTEKMTKSGDDLMLSQSNHSPKLKRHKTMKTFSNYKTV